MGTLLQKSLPHTRPGEGEARGTHTREQELEEQPSRAPIQRGRLSSVVDAVTVGGGFSGRALRTQPWRDRASFWRNWLAAGLCRENGRGSSHCREGRAREKEEALGAMRVPGEQCLPPRGLWVSSSNTWEHGRNATCGPQPRRRGRAVRLGPEGCFNKPR